MIPDDDRSVCSRCKRRGGRTVTRVHKTFDVGLPEPLLVEVVASACAVCRMLVRPAAVEEAAERAAIGAILEAGLVNGRTFFLLRTKLGMRSRDLSALLFAGVGTISRWENDRRALDPKAWILLACLVVDALGDMPMRARRIVDAVERPVPLRPARVVTLPEESHEATSA